MHAAVQSIKLGYDKREDRLLASFHMKDSALPPEPFWFTRRLAVALLVKLGEVLGRTPLAGAAAAERHQAAVTAPQSAPEQPSAAPAEATAEPAVSASLSVDLAAGAADARLVDRLSVRKNGEMMALLVRDAAGVEVAAVMTAEDMHRFLDTFYRKTVEADWHLENAVPWLKSWYFGPEAEIRKGTLN